MISIVICSIAPARFEAVSENLHRLLQDQPHEIIGIHDAKSMAEGYNRGICRSRGDAIIVCHDDIEILEPDFKNRLLSRLQQFDLIGVAGSTRLTGPQWVSAGPPHIFGQIAHVDAQNSCYRILNWSTPAACIPNIQVMDGLFMAGRRAVFETVPFDEETFTGWHLYDLDFTVRAAHANFKLAICNDFIVIHASPGSFEERWKLEAERFVAKHQSAFQPMRIIPWAPMQIRVSTKQEVAEILRSAYWIE